ncbi:MAG: HAMP domain-containing sensor histidine kinase [Candidatus Saccharimonadales bacterium]
MITDLNRQLVGVIDINRMLNLTSEILHNYLNPEFCYFVLSPTNESGSYRIVANKNKKNIDSVDLVLRLARSHSHKKVIFIQQIDSQSNLAKEMSSQDIQALSELTPSNAKDPVGYMVIGIRKSGKAYDLTDSQVIESVSNTLIIAMQNALHFEEIQQFNATLQAQVEEQTRKYRMANEKLKKLDETKDEFISMASHQLRTPLTSVKGYLSMVLEGDVGKLNPQQEQLLKQSFLSSQRMVNLIADLLNLSRLNTGKFVIDAQPTDLTAVVEAELAQLHESAKAKNIELTYVRPETFPTIQLDENKIHQVVMNFIDNAIYYTPEGGQITVTLEETKSSVEFRVKDTGIGVPRALQRHLFVKFYRADNARRMRPDGTGLGIYMAKKVVLAQGGSIIFESQEGKGSTFGFRFGKKSHALVKDGAVIT